MKETGILFNGAMVRAILADLKDQTRRPVKPQPPAECGIHYMLGNESWLPEEKRTPLRHHWEAWHGPLHENRPEGHLCGSHTVRCPFGVPGDRLYVREAWRTGKTLDSHSATRIKKLHDEAGYQGADGTDHCGPIWYEADGVYRAWGDDDATDFGGPGRYRHARFMPRWASRITLEITDVRVERVQSITEEDARREGFEIGHGLDDSSPFFARDAFLASFNRTYPASVERNDWVFVVSFRRLA